MILINSKNKLLISGITFCSVSGLIIVLGAGEAHALKSVEFAIEEICAHMEGNLGGLLMTTAGVGGLISAAFGNMKAMYSCVITAIGAFTVSSLLSLYFPDAAKLCSGGGSGGAGARTKMEMVLPENPAEVSKFNVERAVKTYIEMGKPGNGSEGASESSEKDATNYLEDNQDEDVDLF